MDELNVGDQVYYTGGDVANGAALGEITGVTPGNNFAPAAYTVTFEDGCSMKAQDFLFTGPGRRFMMRSEYEADKATKLAGMREEYCGGEYAERRLEPTRGPSQG